MKKNYYFRLEEPNDFFDVENLVRESFWNIYKPGCSEHYVLHVLREKKDYIKELAFLLELKNEKTLEKMLIGQIAFFKAKIVVDEGVENKNLKGREIPILTFGPICIKKEYQRKGYGKILLDYALDKAQNLGFGAVCMEGNIDFYSTCGFSKAQDKNIFYHGMDRKEDCTFLLLKELTPNYLDGIKGTYFTPEEYFVSDKEVDEYDKQFPYKQKKKLPGQIFS